ncbi:LysR family transcriptional regulator [Bradyrhizobium sp. CCBAU 51753]|uniref:LysR family transcriptional regulator n=1 Tax=Bradyrhizobium sp. CCBAU 51753 TaxID=1325100 RepID=UPI00188ADB5B|nr:LysR family transcriptional regulator [Bradyrhizobium sp. CCBAU 51753]
MDLRQLRYFIGVAERGGFGAAASALNIAQSALSRHIKELERELGGALFTRTARGVAVTESGKVLLERGRWLLGLVDDIKAEVRTENREPSGTVRLGAPSSVAEIFYPPLARLIAARFPRVQLELGEALTELACDRLLRGQLDLAIVTAPQPNDHLCYETLVEEQVFLIGPPDDPKLKRGRMTVNDLKHLSRAMLPLSRTPFPPEVPSFVRVESSTPMKRIVASGLGYALLPYSGIYQEVDAGQLSAALLPWMSAERVLALPRGRPISRATQETRTLLKEICGDLIRDGIIRTSQRKRVIRQQRTSAH